MRQASDGKTSVKCTAASARRDAGRPRSPRRIFSPGGRPRDAIGELWAIWFDGERGKVMAVKSVVPVGHCRFDRTCLSVQVGEARLNEARLAGVAASTGHAIAWDLEYSGDEATVLLLPEDLYDGALRKFEVGIWGRG